MTHLALRAPDQEVRRLAATLYGYAFLSDLVLLYPVYALLFADTGLSVGQISSLFVIWSVGGILLEVPSGAWADAVSRRLLLRLAPLVTAAGYALWVLLPSYPAFAAGFLLWGAGGALVSGALEALVWTELDRLGAAGRYARLLGRAKTAGVLGVLVAGALAGPVLAAGGYLAVGAASVLACLLAAAVAARFPEHRERPAIPSRQDDAAGADDEAELGWWGNLRAGVAQVRSDRPVRAAVLLVGVGGRRLGRPGRVHPAAGPGHRRRRGGRAVAAPAALGRGDRRRAARPGRGAARRPGLRRAARAGRRRVGRRRPGRPSGRVRPARGGVRRRSNWRPCWPTFGSRRGSAEPAAPRSPRWPGWPPT